MAKEIGVVCRDAGGANQILRHVLHNQDKYRFHLDGPAREIFQSAISPMELSSLSEIAQNCDKVIIGTGWQSDFEWQAMKFFKNCGIKVIVYLDHWINYAERFTRNDELVLPDEIWVSDNYAHDLAHQSFPSIPIRLQDNHYITEIKSRFALFQQHFKNLKSQERKRILYISEPIKDVPTYSKSQTSFDEFVVLELFMHQLAKVNTNEYKMVLRLHPSEEDRKYDYLSSQVEIHKPEDYELAEDLAGSDLVVGIDSYAMHVSDTLGIPTLCIAPDANFQSTIPPGRISYLYREGDNLVDYL